MIFISGKENHPFVKTHHSNFHCIWDSQWVQFRWSTIHDFGNPSKPGIESTIQIAQSIQPTWVDGPSFPAGRFYAPYSRISFRTYSVLPNKRTYPQVLTFYWILAQLTVDYMQNIPNIFLAVECKFMPVCFKKALKNYRRPLIC